MPGFPVQAIDTTGAGDAFTAGLLAGLLADPDALADPASLAAVCRFANAMGALATTARGAVRAAPDRGAVDAFIAAHDPARPGGG